MSDDISTLLGAYALDAVDTGERAEVEQYLRDHPDAVTEVDELRSAAGRLATLVEHPPPPALRADVLTAISRVRPLPPAKTDLDAGLDSTSEAGQTRPDDDEARPSRRGVLLAGLGAAATVAVGTGLALTRPWESDQAPPVSAITRIRSAADTRTFDLRMGDRTMQVMRSPSVGRTMVAADSMPAAPSGRVYQVWWQHRDGSMSPAGLLPAGGGTNVEELLSNDGGDAVGAGITLEPAGGSPAPTGSTLALVRF